MLWSSKSCGLIVQLLNTVSFQTNIDLSRSEDHQRETLSGSPNGSIESISSFQKNAMITLSEKCNDHDICTCL